MDIKLSILEGMGEGYKPKIFIYHGKDALPIMFFRIAHIYYGEKIANKILIIINNSDRGE
jgi:hypothetical protein